MRYLMLDKFDTDIGILHNEKVTTASLLADYIKEAILLLEEVIKIII